MKYIVIIFLALLLGLMPFLSSGQNLVMVRDTVNQFEIGVPEGWQYGVPQNRSVDFIAFGQKINPTDVPRETYNIFLTNNEEKDIDRSYQLFVKSLSEAADFKLLEEGETTINNRRYKWLIETHLNKYSGETMANFVLFTNESGRILVLTLATIEDKFDQFKPLFDKIASSLKY